MAIVAAAIMEHIPQESKTVHPFFVKPPKSKEDLRDHPQDHLVQAVLANDINHTLTTSSISTASPSIGSKNTGRPHATKDDQEENEREGAELLEVDPNLDRRKRQKSESGDDSLCSSGLAFSSQVRISFKNENGTQAEQFGAMEKANAHSALAFSSDSIADSDSPQAGSLTAPVDPGRDENTTASLPAPPVRISRLPRAASLHTIGVYVAPELPLDVNPPKPNPPRKMLQLNSKTGTIGSPPKPKLKVAEETKAKTRKARGSKSSKSMIVTIKYGHDPDSCMRIGGKIDHLMEAPVTLLQVTSKSIDISSISSRPVSIDEPPKITHPFFRGKAAPKSEAIGSPKVPNEIVPAAPSKSSSSETFKMFTTPRPISQVRQSKNSAGGFGPAFGNSSKIMKFPGAMEPCWPPRDMMHIRSSGDEGDVSLISLPSWGIGETERKSKRPTVQILPHEEIIRNLTSSLHVAKIVTELSQINSDEYSEPSRLLRVPRKHFESGVQLQKQVRPYLSSHIPLSVENQSSDDELGAGNRWSSKTHPALEKVYNALPTSLTAFDRSTYETQSWIHKYAPKTAAEVLQGGKEAFILKDWLLALTIIAVDTGIVDNQSRPSSGMSKQPAEKRKRKSNKLDGFVISSGEEDNDMDEISEPDDDISPQGSQGMSKRTVVRTRGSSTSKTLGKLANAVVISGPSGCGKTATVYAVAKELGFEVFEINSSSRRSGKDILERVGDMTRNHQVQRSKQGLSGVLDDDISHVTDALAEDLRSGRQGTMSTFFKPKSTKAEHPKTQPKEEKCEKSLPKKQKQSLILLEEVDVLFEEDKQFWATVMGLIAQSKRPIIMTCVDETLVPLQSLVLHAIIRLTPPPLESAVDYMVLVAASEGHIVRRNAVQSLFEARSLDLRATMTDLDYWCQLGVGDCKGGMDWFYPRWPPGSDVDNHGNTIRVVSEGTYETGMGWLGRDILDSQEDQTDVHNELLHEAWHGWQLDMSPLDGINPHLMTLNSYDDLIQSMSAADMSACGRLATENQVLLDITSPPLLTKHRDDFTLGRKLLDADLTNDYDSTATSLSFCIQSMAQGVFKNAIASPEQYQDAPTQVVKAIAREGVRHRGSVSRLDFSLAFDPIAEPERKTFLGVGSLEPSVFDRTTAMIAVDVAPYVRSIVAQDARLQQERAHLSNLLSEGGRKGKRMRTTRAALSALEGGARNTTRPERYFGSALNSVLVMKTGHQSWQDAAASLLETKHSVEEQVREDSTSP